MLLGLAQIEGGKKAEKHSAGGSWDAQLVTWISEAPAEPAQAARAPAFTQLGRPSVLLETKTSLLGSGLITGETRGSFINWKIIVHPNESRSVQMHQIHHRCFYFLKVIKYHFLSLYSKTQVTADPSVRPPVFNYSVSHSLFPT